MTMPDREQDHVAAGWNAGHDFRWIEVGRLRLEEDDKGAIVLMRNILSNVLPNAGSIELPPHGTTWLSATELAGLARNLAAWFAEDPTATIRQIENSANYVKIELEAWNDRARIDEEHPPYDELTRALDGLLGRCRDLREVLGKFAEKVKIITIKEEE
jgi:hypothetical protein